MFDWFRQLFLASPKAAPEAEPQTQAASGKAEAVSRVQNITTHAVLSMQRDQVDFMFASWLFEAESYPEVFTNPSEDVILAALDETVNSPQSGAHMVRRMPGVIPQLLQSLRNSEFVGADLARTISNDIVLVAEVLRLANSASYNPGKAITGIDHAILVLGQDGLRQLITGVAFKPIINLKSGSFTKMLAPKLWMQAERCATVCSLLARDEAVDPLDAFLVGLVHNVGLTVSLRVIDQMSDGRHPVGSPTFCNALHSYGRTLAHNIAREWHFPDAVCTAIYEQCENKRNPNVSPLGRILLMGDHLSKMEILSRYSRLDVDDPKLLEDLSEKEIDCLRELAAVEESEWITVAPGAK